MAIVSVCRRISLDFHEALEVFAGIWIQDLKPLILSSFSEDTKKWIMISSENEDKISGLRS
jgi:hypothetical protein